jgi:hypothetical protein
MASTQTISEFNGANAATETTSRSESNWKRIDDSTTAYTASVINSSNNENSMGKYQALKYAGTWNSISAVTVKIDNNAPATGLSIVGSVINAAAGTTPATTATGDSAMSTTGASVNLANTTTPYVTPGSASSTASGTLYTQACRTQLQTTSSYAGGPGDITSRTITWSWTES